MVVENRAALRLSTWKAVAAYLGCDERTAKRWELSRGLPVHRLPGETRGHVYALVHELAAWRGEFGDREPATATDADPETGSSSRRAGRFAIAGAGLAGLVAVVAISSSFISRDPAPGPAFQTAHAPSLAAQQAYVRATLDWRQRTPDSLERAERGYREAIREDPDYSEAYAGLANTYNLLREYTGMPDSEAYPLAKANALKAIALDNRSASAQAALGFAEYWGYWNVGKAQKAFSAAVQLDPRNSTAHHWYATFLSNLGEEQAALREMEAARVLDPQSTAIAADTGLLLVVAGRQAAGMKLLERLSSGRGDISTPLAYLAVASLRIGRYGEYVDAIRRRAALTRDEAGMRAADSAGLAYRQGGARALLARLIVDRTAAYAKGETSAFEMAALYSMAGDRRKALMQLHISADRHESAFLRISNPLDFRALRNLPEFKKLVARIQPLDG